MILDGSTTYTHKFCKLLHNHCDFLPFLFGELGIIVYLCTQQIKERAPALLADTHFCFRARMLGTLHSIAAYANTAIRAREFLHTIKNKEKQTEWPMS